MGPPFQHPPTMRVGVIAQHKEFLAGVEHHKAEPLGKCLHIWRNKCNLSQWLEKTIDRGYCIQFQSIPPPFQGVEETMVTSPEEVEALETEIKGLLQKGVITKVPWEQREEGFYSRYFLIPKKNLEEYRAILDLRVFNQCVAERKFRMLTTKLLLECIQPGDFAVTVDLKDAYHHVSIIERHRKYFRFSFQGQAFQYSRLPFGFKLAPRTFTKCLEAALEPLRRRGYRVYAYLDDLILLARSAEEAMKQTQEMTKHLVELGFAINWKKSAPWPAQKVSYLGLVLDTRTMRATLSEDRQKSLAALLDKCRTQQKVQALTVQRLLGMMAAAHQVVEMGMLNMRLLQRWYANLKLDSRKDRFRMLRMPQYLQPHLAFWQDTRVITRGARMGVTTARVSVYTDASDDGWGGTCGLQSIGDVFTPQEYRLHINAQEMLAVIKVLHHFLPIIKGKNVLVRSDNRTTVAYINKQGGVRSRIVHLLAVELLEWAGVNLQSLVAKHIPGKENTGADLMSRGGPRASEWKLNPRLVRLMWQHFGKAEVDLFASKGTAQCPLWFGMSPVENPPLGVDAFSTKWPEGLLYAFPPLECIPAMLQKIRTERACVIVVVPEQPGARWFGNMMSMRPSNMWNIPQWEDAMSQAGGEVFSLPMILGHPLKAWMLRG